MYDEDSPDRRLEQALAAARQDHRQMTVDEVIEGVEREGNQITSRAKDRSAVRRVVARKLKDKGKG